MNLLGKKEPPPMAMVNPLEHPRIKCVCGHLFYETGFMVVDRPDPMQIGHHDLLACPVLICKKCKQARFMPMAMELEPMLPIHSNFAKANVTPHPEEKFDREENEKANQERLEDEPE